MSVVALLLLLGCEDRVGPPSQDDVFQLPLGEGAPALVENDLPVITVARADGTPATSEAPDSWRIRLEPNHGYGWRKDDRAALQSDLSRLTKGGQERRVLIRADARTPNRVLQSVFDVTSSLRLNHPFIEVRPSADGTRRAFPCRAVWVCGAGETTEHMESRWAREVRLVMSWNTADRRLERFLCIGVAKPLEIASNSDGDALLSRRLAETRADHQPRGWEDPPIVDGGPRVPWQSIVDGVAAAFRAGWPTEEFALASLSDFDELPQGVPTSDPATRSNR